MFVGSAITHWWDEFAELRVLSHGAGPAWPCSGVITGLAQTGALWAVIRQPLAPGQCPLSAESDSDTAENISAEPEGQPGESRQLLNGFFILLSRTRRAALGSPAWAAGSCVSEGLRTLLCPWGRALAGSGALHSQRDGGTRPETSPCSPSPSCCLLHAGGRGCGWCQLLMKSS